MSLPLCTLSPVLETSEIIRKLHDLASPLSDQQVFLFPLRLLMAFESNTYVYSNSLFSPMTSLQRIIYFLFLSISYIKHCISHFCFNLALEKMLSLEGMLTFLLPSNRIFGSKGVSFLHGYQFYCAKGLAAHHFLSRDEAGGKKSRFIQNARILGDGRLQSKGHSSSQHGQKVSQADKERQNKGKRREVVLALSKQSH